MSKDNGLLTKRRMLMDVALIMGLATNFIFLGYISWNIHQHYEKKREDKEKEAKV